MKDIFQQQLEQELFHLTCEHAKEIRAKWRAKAKEVESLQEQMESLSKQIQEMYRTSA